MGTIMALLHHLLFACLLLLVSGLQLEDIANVKHGSETQKREPKLFYVSYSSTTSTVATASVCYFTSDKAPVTCGRRRRRMAFADDPINPTMADIDPSRQQQVSEQEFKQMEEQIEAGEVEGEESSGREGRFLLYWLTTTTTSTTTSFTATSSIGSIYCTPAGYTNVLCGK